MRQPTHARQLREAAQAAAEHHGRIRHAAHRDAHGHFERAAQAEAAAEPEQPAPPTQQ
jgi:hypothetical protein